MIAHGVGMLGTTVPAHVQVGHWGGHCLPSVQSSLHVSPPNQSTPPAWPAASASTMIRRIRGTTPG